MREARRRPCRTAPATGRATTRCRSPTIHEARFVLFDDDTRLLFATSFDGPWDAYMEDFASKPLKLFDVDLPARRGLRGPAGPRCRQGVHPRARSSPRRRYARNYGGTVKEIRKAHRVNDAFQRVLDDPGGRGSAQHPALAPLLDEAADA